MCKDARTLISAKSRRSALTPGSGGWLREAGASGHWLLPGLRRECSSRATATPRNAARPLARPYPDQSEPGTGTFFPEPGISSTLATWPARGKLVTGNTAQLGVGFEATGWDALDQAVRTACVWGWVLPLRVSRFGLYFRLSCSSPGLSSLAPRRVDARAPPARLLERQEGACAPLPSRSVPQLKGTRGRRIRSAAAATRNSHCLWLPPLCPTSRCLVSRGTLGRWGVSELSFLCRRGLTTSRWDRNSVVKGFGGQVDSLSTTLSWTVPTSLKFWLPFSLTTVLIMPVGRGGGERCYSDRNL